MAYTNIGSQLDITQPFISKPSLSFSGDADGFTQYSLLGPQPEPYLPKINPWFNNSSNYEPASFSFNAADDLHIGPVQRLERASFQIGRPISRLETLGVPLASETLKILELEHENSLRMNSAEMTTSVQELSCLRCSEPGCDDKRMYPTLAKFRKHQEKHSRPYVCQHSSCNHRRFGDRAGLTRHSREVHGTEVHYCPFISCNRHTRGFPRKYNLLQHQRNCHGDRQARHANPKMSQRYMVSKTSSAERPEYENISMELAQSGNEDTNCDSDIESGIERPDACSVGLGRLEKKLRDLKAVRAGINRDIETLERALGLVEDNSS